MDKQKDPRDILDIEFQKVTFEINKIFGNQTKGHGPQHPRYSDLVDINVRYNATDNYRRASKIYQEAQNLLAELSPKVQTTENIKQEVTEA